MGEKKRVIIFDDDQDLLDIFAFVFEEDGWHVHTFQSCDEVVGVASALSPDLILMDNWIPVMGGIAATQLLKSHPDLHSIPVMYVSANNDIAELSKRAGADAYMAKPFDFEPLVILARSLVDKTSSQLF